MKMKEQSSLISYLKDRGYRLTPQRAIIIQAIEELAGHITAEQIFEIVQQKSPYISLATIYRTLDLLKELGLITGSNLGTTTTYYALRGHGPHHHAVCRRCNKLIELPCGLFDPIVEKLCSDYDFAVDANHMIIFGWCQACQTALAEEQPD